MPSDITQPVLSQMGPWRIGRSVATRPGPINVPFIVHHEFDRIVLTMVLASIISISISKEAQAVPAIMGAIPSSRGLRLGSRAC